MGENARAAPRRADDRPVLVTGATGYVGGRLVPRLLAEGHRVRAMSRSRAKLEGRPWARDARVELAIADALDAGALASAAEGCRLAFYLIHSMDPGTRDFAETDARAAENMARAAERGGIARIVYLGGLGEQGAALSEHLRSRREVEAVLREGRVPVTVLRAAMIIGSGSASFEILRYLVERLPVMVTPRWVRTPVQPIAIRNVLDYLVGVAERPETAGSTFEIGGPERTTYREIMEIYAQEAGLPRRVVIPVPVLTPRLSSYWIHLVTPAPAGIARPLAEGLRNPVVVRDERLREMIPTRLLTTREAIRLALAEHRHDLVETHWTDAGKVPPVEWWQPGDAPWAGGTVLMDEERARVAATPEAVWQAIAGIGGMRGYYAANPLWRWRGRIDKVLGGVGLGRGRRHPGEVRPGDALDFWRVADVAPNRRLLLVAEMRLPGEAMLEFELKPAESGGTVVTQTARFLPRGLVGLAYWYALLPLHRVVFRGMLKGIAEASARASSAAGARSAG